MVTKHLTDEELQLFVFDNTNFQPGIAEHILVCMECKAKAEIYRLLATGISQQSQPAFDFNLTELVLEQLPVSKPRASNDKVLTGILVFVCTAFIAGALFYFHNYLANMFEGVAGILIILITISAIMVMAALIFDMHKKYRREMKILDLY